MLRLKHLWVALLTVVSGAAIAFGAFVFGRRYGTRKQAVDDVIHETKQKLDDAKHVAVIELKAAKKRDETVKQRLKDVRSMSDVQERRAELLRLYREVSS